MACCTHRYSAEHGDACNAARAARPAPAAQGAAAAGTFRRPSADPGAGLRRVPDRSASGRRRTAAALPADHARSRDRRHGSYPRPRRRRVSGGRPGRRALAGIHLRALRVLPARPREPLRASALYRLPDGRRLCGIRGCRCAVLLLCAGLIGYRALAQAGDARRLGIYGFGAAAHIVAQVARHEGREVYAFTRAGDEEGQRFARELGAAWAGASGDSPPRPLEAAIIFAPVGALVPIALRAIAKGGRVVCAGIHMSDIPSFPYDILWGERSVRSVANLTRADGEAFLALAPRAGVRTEVEPLPLGRANEALDRLRRG